MLKRLIAAAGVAAICSTAPAYAVTSGDILRGSLYNGLLERGSELLTPAAEAGDAEAAFGLGMLRLFTGVERLLNALYRHGLTAPETGAMGPALPMPLPANPNPEPMDYERFRAVLATLVDDLDAAGALFLAAGESGDYVVKLDPTRFRVDVNGDGRASDSETMGQVVGAMIGEDIPAMSSLSGRGEIKIKPQRNKDGTMLEPGIGFDRADALWFAGYSSAIASQADFLLAHDFSTFLDAIGHRFFPTSDFPMVDLQPSGMLAIDPDTDTGIADLIAAIHTLNWPVAEPERLRRVLERALAVVDLSRRNWAAILAETDDDMELIPSPAQTPQFQGQAGTITTEMVEAWQATLDEVERILEGDLLLPHWRFPAGSGFDLKAYFETAERTDLVMILAGYGALPFIKEGPVAHADTFAEANRVFGGNLMGYAFWFN